MMKWIAYVVLAVLVFGSWMLFSKGDGKIAALQQEITHLESGEDLEDQLPAKRIEMDALKNEKIFSGVLMAFVSAGLVGVFFVCTVLPFLTERLTQSVYDSGEVVKKDALSEARSQIAQGNFPEAIEAFRLAAVEDPDNRVPWVEIVKIQKDTLHDPAAAIATIREVLEMKPWPENDTAYFLFRLAELYHDTQGDRASALAIMQQVIEQFPSTRHSANANHKIHEWSQESVTSMQSLEEEAYLNRMKDQKG
ncbi:MAG: hypothetical protein EAZ42_10300 [Verrucomicrobia bacterium]|nr:MAG: hypothetical protein EAZ42_10300 [Verrucomicrobiota bacterium]